MAMQLLFLILLTRGVTWLRVAQVWHGRYVYEHTEDKLLWYHGDEGNGFHGWLVGTKGCVTKGCATFYLPSSVAYSPEESTGEWMVYIPDDKGEQKATRAPRLSLTKAREHPVRRKAWRPLADAAEAVVVVRTEPRGDGWPASNLSAGANEHERRVLGVYACRRPPPTPTTSLPSPCRRLLTMHST